jgi:hypothetical protein
MWFSLLNFRNFVLAVCDVFQPALVVGRAVVVGRARASEIEHYSALKKSEGS